MSLVCAEHKLGVLRRLACESWRVDLIDARSHSVPKEQLVAMCKYCELRHVSLQSFTHMVCVSGRDAVAALT